MQCPLPRMQIAKNFLMTTTTIPFFHARKHKAPLNEPIPADNSQQESDNPEQEESMLEENFFCTRLNTQTTSEFLSNILFCISGLWYLNWLRKFHIHPVRPAF